MGESPSLAADSRERAALAPTAPAPECFLKEGR
jgi:hypothetical protein